MSDTTDLDITYIPANAETPVTGDAPKTKLAQTVDIQDVGPCKKHIKVTVERGDIDRHFEDKFKGLMDKSWIPGFRPGKAPKKMVVKHHRKEVNDQVKGEILLASLEQLAEDFDVAPLSPPNLNPSSIIIPEDGPFVYEFEVEVRPQFDLPEYKGLSLQRPMRTFSDEEVVEEESRILARHGQLVPKDGAAEKGDYLIVDMVTNFKNEKVGEASEVTFRIDDALTFRDGVAQRFAEQTVGAKAGDQRTVDITMTDAVAVGGLKGQTVQAVLQVKDVKKLRLPELSSEFLAETFQVKSIDQFRETVRLSMDRRLEYTQRQSAREQVLAKITASSDWDLPQDLLMRQARRALGRRAMEMREAGISEDEIQSRLRMLQRDVLSSTASSLKEHFVLQKIAENEKLEINEDEINDEIERIADQYGEPARRIRAQFERDDLLETLAAQLIERKALNLILENATYEDVQLGKDGGMTTSQTQAVAGEIKDPTAAPAEEKASDEEQPAS